MYRKPVEMVKILFKKGDNSLTRQAIKNSAFSAATSIVSKAGGLIFTILLARALLPDLFGLYSLVISILLTVGTFADLGVNTAITRYISDSLARNNFKEARARLYYLVKVKLVITLITAAILFFSAPLIAKFLYHRPELVQLLQIGALYILALAVQSFFNSLIIPMKRLDYNFLAELGFQASKIGLFLIFVSFYKNVSSVLFSLTFAFLVPSIIYFGIITLKHREVLFGSMEKISNKQKKEISHFLGWSSFNVILLSLYLSANPFILGLFVKNEIIGYFTAIFSIVTPVISLINISAVFLPIFTEISGDRLKRGFDKVILYTSILGIPAAFGLAYMMPWAISSIYGAEFFPKEFYLPLLISSIVTCILIPIEILSSVLDSIFISKEKVKIITIRFIVSNVALILLDVLLAKYMLRFGEIWVILGVCIATLITRGITFLVLISLIKKTFNFKISTRILINPVISSIVMLGFLFLFEKIFKPHSFYNLIMIALAILVYFFVFTNLRRVIK